VLPGFERLTVVPPIRRLEVLDLVDQGLQLVYERGVAPFTPHWYEVILHGQIVHGDRSSLDAGRRAVRPAK
jgi:hypothetical protein